MEIELILVMAFGYYLMINYLNPSIWFYRNVINSIGFRLLILSTIIIVKYALVIGQNELVWILDILIFTLVISLLLQFYRSILINSTPLVLTPTEKEIMSDRAQIISRGNKLGGRIILTNKRLSFVSNNRGKTQFDFFLLNSDAHIRVIHSFGIPSKLKIPNENIYIKVKFPYWWRKMFLSLNLKSNAV